MLPGTPTIVGRANIAKLMEEAWKTVKPKRVRFSTDEVFGVGNMAVTVGTYRFTLQPADGEEVEDEGRFMLLWSLDGEGVWRVARDVTNSSLPTG